MVLLEDEKAHLKMVFKKEKTKTLRSMKSKKDHRLLWLQIICKKKKVLELW